MPSGTALDLTATVTANGAPVTTGQVKFCEQPQGSISPNFPCQDIHLLGTAQILNAGPHVGSALLRFFPAIGNHTYKAIFVGTPHGTPPYAASISDPATLAVTGTFPTSTTLASTGSVGAYSLTATVTGAVNTLQAPGPTGALSLLDSTTNQAVPGSATLTATSASPSLTWTTTSLPFGARLRPLLADLNGDGITDTIFFEPNDSADLNITVMLGNGDGSFTPAKGSPYPLTNLPSYITALALGDFNNDGKPDIAATVPSSPGITLQLFFGNGDGTFTPAGVSAYNTISGNARFGLVDDYNGDGNLDLLSPAEGLVLFGHGDGTFTSQPMGVSSPQYGDLASAGDLNGDGIPDLFAVDALNLAYPLFGDSSLSGQVNVGIYLGNGDGTFSFFQTINAGQDGPLSVATADFDGDGKPDLAIGDGHRNKLTLYKGVGDGTFTQVPGDPIFVENPFTLAVADFNADGHPDLMVGSWSYPDVLAFLGQGDGTFIAGPPLSSIGNQNTGIALADLNGDGLPDIVTNAGDPGPEIILTQLTQTATATLKSIAPLGTGIHQVSASYGGDSNYASSHSAPVSLTAQQLTPMLTLTPASSSVGTAQPLAVSVAVAGPADSPAASGSVTFTSGSYTSTPIPLVNGKASLVIPASTFPAGAAILTATYSGDGNYTATTGTTNLTIVAAGFSLAGTDISLKAGATSGNISALTLTSMGGFNGPVTLTAAITASPAGVVSPPTFTLSPASPVGLTDTASATLAFNTTAPTVCGVPVAQNSSKPVVLAGGFFACIFLGLLRRHRHLGLLSLTLALFVCAFFAGCSGKPSQATCNVATPGTTSGNYTLTVTGTSGAMSATTTITLTVL